jgi:hypothetical protein
MFSISHSANTNAILDFFTYRQKLLLINSGYGLEAHEGTVTSEIDGIPVFSHISIFRSSIE